MAGNVQTMKHQRHNAQVVLVSGDSDSVTLRPNGQLKRSRLGDDLLTSDEKGGGLAMVTALAASNGRRM